MIDISDVPETVTKLAVGCFLQNLGPKELLELPPESTVAVIENFGISVDDYLDAIHWLADYHSRHAGALERYVAQRAGKN